MLQIVFLLDVFIISVKVVESTCIPQEWIQGGMAVVSLSS